GAPDNRREGRAATAGRAPGPNKDEGPAQADDAPREDRLARHNCSTIARDTVTSREERMGSQRWLVVAAILGSLIIGVAAYDVGLMQGAARAAADAGTEVPYGYAWG